MKKIRRVIEDTDRRIESGEISMADREWELRDAVYVATLEYAK